MHLFAARSGRHFVVGWLLRAPLPFCFRSGSIFAARDKGGLVAFSSRVRRRRAIVASSIACLVLVPACGSSSTSATSNSSTASSNTGAAGTPASSAKTSPPIVAEPPKSCSAIPVSLIGPYIGGVATTKSLGPPPNGVSCEFANSSASSIVVVNIGQGGTTSSFAALRAVSGQGGRTVAPISGLGSSAFSISQNGVPGGVDVLTAQGLVFSVAANLPLAQDEALIKQLMRLY